MSTPKKRKANDEVSAENPKSKKSRKTIDTKLKLEIINKKEKSSITIHQLAMEYGLSASTVSTILLPENITK